MSPIKIIVAEDIPAILDMICHMVAEVKPEIEIVGKYTTLEETRQGIDTHKPDAVLLDIQFEYEGKTAFDMLKNYADAQKLDFEIIIVTSHNETDYYAMSFKYKALHFISKPVDKKELKEALERIPARKEPEKMAGHSLTTDYKKDKLIVNTVMGSSILNTKDIVYLISKDSYTDIYLSNGKKIRSSRNLGFFENQLNGICPVFFRIHNGIILNLDYLVKISSKTFRTLILKEPFGELSASKDKLKALMNFLGMR